MQLQKSAVLLATLVHAIRICYYITSHGIVVTNFSGGNNASSGIIVHVTDTHALPFVLWDDLDSLQNAEDSPILGHVFSSCDAEWCPAAWAALVWYYTLGAPVANGMSARHNAGNPWKEHGGVACEVCEANVARYRFSN
jgi:hypothetical protein